MTSPGSANAAPSGATTLTSEQRQKWDRDGYLILPQFFGPDIVDPINGLIERLSHPSARSTELAGRVVVDLLAGLRTGACGWPTRRTRPSTPGQIQRPVLECDVIRDAI